MSQRWFYAIIIMSVVLSACAPLGGTLEAGVVAETQETVVLPSATLIQSTETPAPMNETGAVTGKICYPSENVPSMTAYFQNNDTGEVNQLPIAENQDSYTLEVEPGDYIAFAYREDQSMSLGGIYSEAVACGLSAECTDHSLLVFTVLPGQTIEGIDICDWYAQDQIPPAPGETTQNGPYQDIAGLVYSDIPAEETWWIDSHGFPQRLYPERDAKPSPDGKQLLLDREEDIWLVDLTTGEETNLTSDTNRLEGSSQWWPANPQVIVFNSVKNNEDGWGMSYGQASIVLQDGSGYQVLDENSSFWSPAPSPDGKTIAYDTGSAAWLYHLDTGRKPFNAGDYGLDIPADFKIGSPAWSPDGTKLAWWVGGSFAPSGEWILALALFDLQTKDVQFIHQFQPVGGSEGWRPPVQWSPDGEMLAFTTQGQGRVPDIIVMRVDGSEFTNLGSGAMPLWSPDSSKLIFLHPDPGGGTFLEDDLMILNRESWQAIPLDLPPGSRHIQWAGG
jgi:Tol biopolymer transport system component